MSELYTEDVFGLSGSRCQQLCVKLEPRGLLYIKLSLQEKWDTQVQNPTAAADTCSTELDLTGTSRSPGRGHIVLLVWTVLQIAQLENFEYSNNVYNGKSKLSHIHYT